MKKVQWDAAFYGKNSIIKSKVLSTVDELKDFQKFYNQEKGVFVELTYLITADLVKVFYIDESEWLAGYVINSNGYLRYLEPFDELTRKMIYRDAGLQPTQITEISCIRIEKKLTKLDSASRLFVYRSSINDATLSEKEYIIGGSVIMTVWKTFEIVLPNTLYFGLVPFEENNYQMGKIVFNAAKDANDRFDSYLFNQFE